MNQRTIADLSVAPIGLGGMPMSVEGRPERDRSIRTIHAALDAGVTLIDTADAYHRDANDVGHNEILIAEAIARWSGDDDSILVATKAGHTRPGDGSWAQDGSPEHIKSAAKASATRLGVDALGLLYFHRPDPNVPYAESVGALAELLDEGVIRKAGISNADIAQIDEAQEVLGGRLAAVQNQFSPAFVTSHVEMRHCNDLGVAFLPWSPLGGIGSAADLGTNHDVFGEVAEAYGVSPHQVALAWELALSPNVIPIPGASRPESITDSVKAQDLKLTDEDMEVLNEVL